MADTLSANIPKHSKAFPLLLHETEHNSPTTPQARERRNSSTSPVCWRWITSEAAA
jgi:hypothetical protein